MTAHSRLLVACFGVAAALATVAQAEPAPPASARLSCRPEAGPGRVLCELEVEASSAFRLSWADSLVVRSPEFASPLRARVGPSQASAKTPTRLRLPIALAATSAGEGQLEVSARWVVCRAEAACESGRALTKAGVRVGSVSDP